MVAVAALVAVTLAGLVPSSDILSGFGHPTVITVAAVLVISRALSNSGIVDVVSRALSPYTENLAMHIIVLSGVCAMASAFMNNVGAIAIMLPVALASCAERGGRPPSFSCPWPSAAF